MALQSQHKPEYQTDDRGYGNNSPQDEVMSPGDGEAQESDGDGDLCDGACPDVTSLAKPPPLRVDCQYRSLSCVPLHGGLSHIEELTNMAVSMVPRCTSSNDL